MTQDRFLFYTMLLLIEAIALGILLITLAPSYSDTTIYYTTRVVEDDNTMAINTEIERIKNDDKTNPVCTYWMDGSGNGHGCLTDVQLDALNNISNILK